MYTADCVDCGGLIELAVPYSLEIYCTVVLDYIVHVPFMGIPFEWGVGVAPAHNNDRVLWLAM